MFKYVKHICECVTWLDGSFLPVWDLKLSDRSELKRLGRVAVLILLVIATEWPVTGLSSVGVPTGVLASGDVASVSIDE